MSSLTDTTLVQIQCSDRVHALSVVLCQKLVELHELRDGLPRSRDLLGDLVRRIGPFLAAKAAVDLRHIGLEIFFLELRDLHGRSKPEGVPDHVHEGRWQRIEHDLRHWILARHPQPASIEKYLRTARRKLRSKACWETDLLAVLMPDGDTLAPGPSQAATLLQLVRARHRRAFNRAGVWKRWWWERKLKSLTVVLDSARLEPIRVHQFLLEARARLERDRDDASPVQVDQLIHDLTAMVNELAEELG